ncbi:hypothetical protein JW865_08420 [Candidatus Bathyarchaeota archaeon]|nr:hypothetical protein [Candidatus Bathyarchaeota archaeon]
MGDVKNFMDYWQVLKYAGNNQVRKDSGSKVRYRWIS